MAVTLDARKRIKGAVGAAEGEKSPQLREAGCIRPGQKDILRAFSQ